VPRLPLAKPELVQTSGQRGLKSASTVMATLVGGQTVAASKDDVHHSVSED